MHSSLRLPLPALALASTIVAQGSFDLDKTTNGMLGQPLVLAVANAPAASSLLFMVSTNAGPTPLSWVDPSDPRALAVGLELSAFWYSVPTGSGSTTVGLPIPNDPGLAGATLQMQGLTYPGSTYLIGALSNAVRAQLGIVSQPTLLPNGLVASRALAAGFRAGRDLVLAGGGQGSLLSATGLASSEIYDGRTMRVRAGNSMNGARALATSVVLPDGRVLIAGGVDAIGNVVATAEVYNPSTGTFTATASMSVARATHEATLLNDGRVLVVGGTTTLADAVSALANAQSSAEIWNPNTGTWSNAAGMSDRLLAPDLTTLNDGRVLLSGGFDVDSLFGIPIPIGSINRCRIYNPATNGWSNASPMTNSRGAHSFNTLRLADGRVLVTGGATSGADLTQAVSLNSVEVYDPTTNTWSSAPAMATRRALHTATLLSNGRVLVVGGADGTLSAPVEVGSVQEYDPANNTWRALSNLVTARAGHAALATDDGLVVVLGGQSQGGSQSLASIETIRP